MTPPPVSLEEADRLLAPFARFRHVVLAVSGGIDSLALMLLAGLWRERQGAPPGLIAVTVDHGLRAGSAAEAELVARHARSLGLPHRTVRWEGAKPASGVQAQARRARYLLLAEAAREAARSTGATGAVAAAVATAHSEDDQAETVLMRLLRGSGVEGLAAIPPEGRAAAPEAADGEGCPVALLRPLLSVPRQRLAATVAARGWDHVEDPSNADARFERVRVRQILAALEPLGLTGAALARTAGRMRRAGVALEAVAARVAARVIDAEPGVFARLDRAALAQEPLEIGIRVLRRLLASLGGAAPPAELTAIEEACGRLLSGNGGAQALTLGGCLLHPEAGARTLLVCRETGRGSGLETCLLAPGGSKVWDRRFRVALAPESDDSLELGPLGEDGRALLSEHAALALVALPLEALRGLPALRRNGRVFAVPTLGRLAERVGAHEVAARLAGPPGMITVTALAGQACAKPD